MIDQLASREQPYPALPAWRMILPIVGGFIFNLTFGLIYTFGNISIYVISYIRWAGDETVRIKDFSWVYSIAVATLGITMFFGGMLQYRIGIRRSALLGAAIFSFSLLSSAYTVRSLTWFAISFGFVFGLADGLSYSCPLAAAHKWWPHRKGLVSGIVLGGTSVSPFFFGPLQTWIVNPENKAPTLQPYKEFPNELYFDDEEILSRVPLVFVALGCIGTILSILSAVTLASPPLGYKTRAPFQPHIENGDIAFRSTLPWRNAVNNKSPRQILYKKQFWIIWSIFLLLGQFVIYLSLFWKLIGISEFGISDKRLSLYGNAVIALGNTSGRLFWGFLADRMSIGYVFFTVSIIMMLTTLSFSSVLLLPKMFYFSWVTLLYFTIGGVFVSIPMAATRIFGDAHFAANYGLILTARVVGAVLASAALSLLYGRFSSIHFSYGLAACAALAAVLSAFLKEDVYVEEQERKER